MASFATCITIQEVLEEMAKFRAALRKYYNSKNQSCVIFERNFRSQHLQLQVVTYYINFVDCGFLAVKLNDLWIYM